MKRTLVAAMLIVSSVAVVATVVQKQHSTGAGNQTLTDDSRIRSLRLTADGNPAPPFPKPPSQKVSGRAGGADLSPKLTADGNPAPPFPPKPPVQSTTMAV